MLTIKVMSVKGQVHFIPVSPMARALACRIGALVLTAQQLSDEAFRLDVDVVISSGNCVEAAQLLGKHFSSAAA